MERFDLHLTSLELVEMRPLRPKDWEELFAVAADPLIWEMHPARDRYKEEFFREYFREALESGGALVVASSASYFCKAEKRGKLPHAFKCFPKGIAYSAEGALYISDTENHVIRRVDLRNGMISTGIGTGERGDGPDGGPPSCQLQRPHGVFVHGRMLYIGDNENRRIRTMQL